VLLGVVVSWPFLCLPELGLLFASRGLPALGDFFPRLPTSSATPSTADIPDMSKQALRICCTAVFANFAAISLPNTSAGQPAVSARLDLSTGKKRLPPSWCLKVAKWLAHSVEEANNAAFVSSSQSLNCGKMLMT
jgi:hypothetical protein